MGFLSLKVEKSHLKIINRALKPLGLKPSLNEEWEIHGPHQDMNYHVYAGHVSDRFGFMHCVSITPEGVYEINSPSDWWNTKEEGKL